MSSRAAIAPQSALVIVAATLAIIATVFGYKAAAESPSSNATSTKSGAFTAAQAERGKVVYERACQNCHQVEFYREKLTRWENKSVGALFESVSTTMPGDNVGSLATSEYLDVLTYIFLITGSPTGSQELTTDNMDSVSIAAIQ